MRKEFKEKVSSEMVDYIEDSLNCMLEEVEIMYDGDSNKWDIVEEYREEVSKIMNRVKE
jgi:hypothetical protein